MKSKNFLEKFNFKKKLIFIIGGSGLIGSAISKNFISLGAKIVIVDFKNSKKKLKNVNYYNLDKKNDYDDDIFLNKLFNNYGCPDIFINASYPRTKDWASNSFKNIKPFSMKKNVDMHLNFFCWSTRVVAENMKKKKKKGKIILLNSIYGIRGQDQNIYINTNMSENMTYSIIKGGITNFVRQAGSYFGRYNIQINSIISGGVKGHVSGISKSQNKNFIRNYSKKCPMKRLAQPEEIANLVTYLSSDASDYINASNIVIDGGITAI